MTNQIEIYQAVDDQVQVYVRFDHDTVWLSQKNMAELFDKDSDTIGLHLKNIYLEEELEEVATTELFSVVQKEGNRKVNRNIKFYNLDAIISVGYRVNSKRGTQFRQLATKRFKEGISILHRAIEHQAKNLEDAKDLAHLLEQFSAGLLLLDDYDHETLDTKGKTAGSTIRIEKKSYMNVIDSMRWQLSHFLLPSANPAKWKPSKRLLSAY